MKPTKKNLEKDEETDNGEHKGKLEDHKMEVDKVPLADRIVAQREKNGLISYRIRWKDHGAHEDSWAPRDEVLEKYPVLLEEWEKTHKVHAKKKRARSEDLNSLPAPPSKKRSLPKIITKEKITQICGIRQNEEQWKWVVELKDGSRADLPGEHLIQLQPMMFLQFVEKSIKKKS